jgi:hypothetical protein
MWCKETDIYLRIAKNCALTDNYDAFASNTTVCAESNRLGYIMFGWTGSGSVRLGPFSLSRVH